MSGRDSRRRLPPVKEIEIGRQMVDALRAVLGLGPLYRADRESPSWRVVEVYDGGSLGDGNRRRGRVPVL